MCKILLKITGYIFAIMISIVMIVFIVLQFTVHDDYSIMNDELNTLTGPWTVQYEGRESYQVKLPAKLDDVSVNTPVTISTVLPEINDEFECLCIHAAEQDVEVYIDGELRESYCDESTRLFGSYSAAAFLMLDLTQEDSNKELKIVYTTTISKYTGHLSRIFIDTKANTLLWMFDRYGMQSICALMVLVVGLAFIFAYLLMRIYRRKEKAFLYLSLFAMFYGLSALCQSNAKQLYFPNLFATNAMIYIGLNACISPLLLYMDHIQEQRYRKIYEPIIIISFAYFIISMILQLTGVTDLINLIDFTYLEIVVAAIAVTGLLIVDFRHKIGRETGLILIGVVLLAIITLIEIINMFLPGGFITGKYQNLGVLMFIVVLGASSIRELMIKKNEFNLIVQKNKLKDQFLANFSHEIRTPINTILGMNEMILRETDSNSIKEYADNINKAGTILLDMVGDVLDFSRIESGQNEIFCEKYSLRALIDRTSTLIKCKYDDKNLSYSVNFNNVKHDKFYGDKKHIQQILINVLSNAVKYTKNGSIKLSIEEIDEDESMCTIQFTVTDTGIGIRESDISSIFESFKRVDENINSNIEGTGLGLTITKNLVNAMHGNIKADSKYGTGSTFTIQIPQEIVLCESQKSEESEQITYAIAPDSRVLIVDDNKMNLVVFRNLLKRTSIKIDAVTNAKDCLTLTAMRTYDVIFMDHMMPEKDGIETFHLLRNQENGLNKNCPVIALTANVIYGAEEVYLKEGFDGYLAKPFTGQALDRIIVKYISK